MQEWKTLRVDYSTKKLLELISRDTLIAQSTIVRIALQEYIENHRREK